MGAIPACVGVSKFDAVAEADRGLELAEVLPALERELEDATLGATLSTLSALHAALAHVRTTTKVDVDIAVDLRTVQVAQDARIVEARIKGYSKKVETRLARVLNIPASSTNMLDRVEETQLQTSCDDPSCDIRPRDTCILVNRLLEVRCHTPRTTRPA